MEPSESALLQEIKELLEKQNRLLLYIGANLRHERHEQRTRVCNPPPLMSRRDQDTFRKALEGLVERWPRP